VSTARAGALLQARRQGFGLAAVQADPGWRPARGGPDAGEGQLQGAGGRMEAQLRRLDIRCSSWRPMPNQSGSPLASTTTGCWA
jgi:hypothetical protein